MRLIDADELLERMKGMNMLFSPKIVIDNMPIAYNVEQVVEELGKSKRVYYNERIDDYSNYIVDLDVAIEIVKRGGLNV